MRKATLILSIMVIMGFMMINLGNKTTVAEGEKLDLLTMASVIQDENIIISEWTIHAREKMEKFHTLEDVKAYTGQLKQSYPDWEWNFKNTGKYWEATAFSQKNGLSETVKILSTPTKGQVQTYMIYEAKGKGWEKENQLDLTSRIEARISDIFHGNATIFSCIKGEFNDKMNKSLPYTVEQLLTAFNAKEIEALKEENFMSTSAYSPLFNESVETDGKDMNLQLGLRTQGLGAKTTIVIGTPIITIEY